MGRILVPIDPSRMGYQRQTGDYQSNYQSPFEGILPHVLVNTAIPLAGKLAGAGAQRYANYRGEQDLAAKRAQYEAQNAPMSGRGPVPGSMSLAPEAAPGGERMGPASMERSPRAAAAGALSSPVQDRTIMGSVQPPRQDLFAGGEPNPVAEGWFGQPAPGQPVPGVTGYMRLQPGEGASQTPGFDDPSAWSLSRSDLPTGPRTGVPITEAMVDEEGNPIQLAAGGAPGAWSRALDAIGRWGAVKQGMQPYKASARGARPAAPPVGSPRRLAAEKMMQDAGAPIPTSAAPPPARPLAGGQRVEVQATPQMQARSEPFVPPPPPASSAEIDVSGLVPKGHRIPGSSATPPPARLTPPPVGPGVEQPGYAATQPPVRYGPQQGPGWKTPQELSQTPPVYQDLTAPKLGSGARQLAAGALGAGAIGAGGVAAANMGGYQPVGVPVAAPPSGASGVAVGLPPSGPSSPPPAVAPPPPDTTGTASATGPAGGPASTAPGVRNYGIPGGRRIDESRAVAALGDLTPDAAKVDIPPPAAVAGTTAATADASTAATAPPKPPRQLLRPGVHDYQTLMNAAAIAQTPEEKQQVLAAAELSGLVDAPSESWLDVINPGARTARGFAQLRGVLGDAGGKTDPLLALKAEEITSRNLDRERRAQDRSRDDELLAARTQIEKARAGEAVTQEREKSRKATLDNERRQEELAYIAPLLTAKLGAARATAIIRAQDAADRGEMNEATMQFKRAAAGLSSAKVTEIYNMLPLRMRESIAKAAMFDRMPAASTQVSFGERRAAGTEDDLIKAHRTDRLKANAFSKALSILATRGTKDALDYIVTSPATFGRLGDDIGKANLTAEALAERLQRESASSKERVSTLETEIKERGGTISATGTVTFPPVGK